MHYPWWFVPHLTSPMLIAAIAVVHVLVSHYAVGGSLFLAVEVGYAYRKGDREYLGYLKKHARFFILLTIVFGAITGVGIWWTIGLASPLATAVLIRTFVFGWAIEYVAFVVELVSAFIFYYYWDRLSQKTLLAIVWIYALAAWFSLVAITCITAFMLNPGGWLENQTFWSAMLNPQALPQIIARTGGALMLASLYVYLHASLLLRDDRLRNLIASRSARPALLGAVLITIGGASWHYFLPESARAVLATAAALNVLMALIFALTIVVFILLYVGPYRNPGWLSPGFAITLFLFGLAAFSTGEFIREAVRKPYIVYNVVFSHQVLPEEVPTLRSKGFLEGGTWTKAYVKERYPQVFEGEQIIESRLLELRPEDQLALGETIFQYHCNDCHAVREGYSAVGRLLQGRPPAMIQSMVEHLHLAHFFMPPWSGTKEEAEILTVFLASVAPPRPQGMLPPDSKLPPLSAVEETK